MVDRKADAHSKNRYASRSTKCTVARLECIHVHNNNSNNPDLWQFHICF